MDKPKEPLKCSACPASIVVILVVVLCRTSNDFLFSLTLVSGHYLVYYAHIVRANLQVAIWLKEWFSTVAL